MSLVNNLELFDINYYAWYSNINETIQICLMEEGI